MHNIDRTDLYLAEREPITFRLESQLANYTGAKHCITVASAREAIIIALTVLDIKAGDEVIMGPLSYMDVAGAIMEVGATPIFCDIENATCNLDPSRLKSVISSNTRAIIVASMFGQPADMDEINRFARRHGITVIEDASNSLGASYKGTKSCNLSSLAFTDFANFTDTPHLPKGGALFTSDDYVAKKIRRLCSHCDDYSFENIQTPIHGYMRTLTCALISNRWPRFALELSHRAAKKQIYDRIICGHARPVAQVNDRVSANFQYAFVVDDRGRVEENLRRATKPVSVYCHQVPTITRYRYLLTSANARDSCRAATDIESRLMTLPLDSRFDNDFTNEIAMNLLEAICE